MGKAARNRARAVSDLRPATLHESLGTEPANLPPAPPSRAAVVRRAASAVSTSAVTSLVDHLGRDNGLQALRAVPDAQVALELLTRQAVELARAQGSTWADVGAVFGMTKQAAQQRWGR